MVAAIMLFSGTAKYSTPLLSKASKIHHVYKEYVLIKKSYNPKRKQKASSTSDTIDCNSVLGTLQMPYGSCMHCYRPTFLRQDMLNATARGKHAYSCETEMRGCPFTHDQKQYVARPTYD